ncbi:uncharacterized protein LOC143282781 [Babylonia areolata]|uniref:uncharacterized protein LOC143282781 n=1 Tax=Babylonia areolata TaxID=304850 RepID=UPI003FD5ECC5
MDRTDIGVVWLCLGCVLVTAHARNVNVAPGKAYSQSSKWNWHDKSSQAANGVRAEDYPRNGIHTRFDDNPWWEVDLGRTYPLKNIVIWARPKFQRRLYPTNITVDGRMCAAIQDFPSSTNKKELECPAVMYGRKVRITLQSKTETLNLNEMEIFVPSGVSVCPAGRRGSSCVLHCSQHCGKGPGKNFCYQHTGHCYDDCQSGWYGKNCSGQCGHCQNKHLADYCDTLTGNCHDGCQDGWQPPLCQEECDDGNWGAGCGQTCGQCKEGSACDKEDGQCPLCEPGWTPPRCADQCPDGWYGENCSQQCGTCLDGAACNKVTGHCTCAVGKQPPFCQTDCQNKTYGQQCAHGCGQCRGQKCDPVSGHCPEGCQPGWTDPPASPAVLCQTAQEDDSANTGVVVGGVAAAAVIVIAIVIVIVIFMMRRRKRAAQMSGSSHVSVRALCGAEGEVPGSALPNTEPPTTDDPVDARPMAQVEPTVKLSPSQNEVSVYQNVSLQQHRSAPQPSPAPSDRSEKGARAGGPPQKAAMPLPGAQRALTASRDTLTEEEDMDALFSGKELYSNDPLSDGFEAAIIRLDHLQKTIVDSLQNGKVAADFGRMDGQKEFPVSNGQRKENEYKNRFRSILPYDKTRVVLEQIGGDDASDYINASFVKGYKTEKAYIACQGPKNNTQDDFWRMVWQEGVTHIVMLTNLKEGKKSKCHEYWPAKRQSLTTGHMEVTGLEVEERAHFIIRNFILRKKKGKDERHVKQYHYVKWMDHEVPSATHLVDFWRYVTARASRTPTAPPLLVHCSAGVGRTGTYIALDMVMEQSEEEDTICLYTTVSTLRDYRCHMVQNKDQYQFLHEAVLEAYMSGDSRLDTSSFDRVFPSTIRHGLPLPRVDAEFQRLCQMRTCLTDPSHAAASLEENRPKNRNPDALPDDKHLVYITKHWKGRNQYINAVYMPTFLSERGRIVTQLPLADTVMDLWRLVDSWDVSTIVSLGQVEGRQDMCGYWPVPKGPPLTCGHYTISFRSVSSLGDSLCAYSVEMKKQDQSREVSVLHYQAWTGEVADNVPDLLRLLDILHTSHRQPTKGPVIVQCIDGVAKSGVLCALWDVISRVTYDGDVDVYLAVRHVHTVRPEAITSVTQYRFIYEVLQQHLDSYNVYVNT